MMGGDWTDFGGWAMGFGMVMNRAQTRGTDRHAESAEDVLRERFARGDIDAEEYEHRLATLRR